MFCGNLASAQSPVFDLDAGLNASYSGSGQTFASSNLNTTYDFWLGNNNSATANDPTFNGVAGADSTAEYFSGDGGDFFTIKANDTFINSLHKENALFSWYAFMKTPTVHDKFLLETLGTSPTGVGLRFHLGGSNALKFDVGDGVSQITIASTGSSFISTSTSYLIALSYNESTGVGLIYLKSDAGVKSTYNFSNTYNAAGLTPSSSTASLPLNIYGSGPNILGTGWRLWKTGMTNTAMTEAQLDDLWATYHSRKLA